MSIGPASGGGTSPSVGQPFAAASSGLSVTLDFATQKLSMTRDKLILELNNARQRRKPHGEWCLIPLAMFLGLVPYAVTAVTFKDGFFFTAQEWPVLVKFLTAITFLVSAGLFLVWLVRLWGFRQETSPQIVDRIMREERELNERLRKELESSETP